MQNCAAGSRSSLRWPVAFSRATAWFKFVPTRRTNPAAAITSTSASRNGDNALASAPRAEASVASAANAPAPALTSEQLG
jgi:hypothetical protein